MSTANDEWAAVVQRYNEYLGSSYRLQMAKNRLLSDAIESRDRVSALKAALRSRDYAAALEVAKSLPVDELEELVPELVERCIGPHGVIQTARGLIASLPHEWIVGSISAVTEPILEHGTDEEYRRILELYELLDKDMTIELAHRAKSHTDPHIQEAGADFLERLD